MMCISLKALSHRPMFWFIIFLLYFLTRDFGTRDTGQTHRLASRSLASRVFYNNFFFKVSIMSTVILSRSYLGFQPHSARAQLSSILFGQLSAMA